MLDVFRGDTYNSISLTAAINKAPFKPGRIGELGLFEEKGIPTTTVMVEEESGKLYLIPSAARGTMPTTVSRPRRKTRSFVVPHFPLFDEVLADEVTNIRKFGTEDQLEAIDDVVADKLERHRQSFEMTHEYLRIGAIQGIVKDSDMSSTLFNWFTEFGISETEINFYLDNDDMKWMATQVIRAMEDALGQTPYTKIRAFCGNDFWDRFVSNASVKNAFFLYQENSFLRDQKRDGFEFGGITWENYRGKVGNTPFVPSQTCRFVAEGVPELFQTNFAPANMIEAVNTIGLPTYAKQQVMDFDMGIQLFMQSNPIMICTRPNTLIKGTYKSGTTTTTTTAP